MYIKILRVYKYIYIYTYTYYIRFPVIQIRNHVAELQGKKLNMYKCRDDLFGHVEKVNVRTPAPGLSKQLINVLNTQCPMFLVYLQVPDFNKHLQAILLLQRKAKDMFTMLTRCLHKTTLININVKNATFCSSYWSLASKHWYEHALTPYINPALPSWESVCDPQCRSKFSGDLVRGRHCKAGLCIWSSNNVYQDFWWFSAIRATFCRPLLSACGMCSPSICLPGTRRYQQNRCATQTILCEPVPPQSMLHPRCSPRMHISWILIASPRGKTTWLQNAQNAPCKTRVQIGSCSLLCSTL